MDNTGETLRLPPTEQEIFAVVGDRNAVDLGSKGADAESYIEIKGRVGSKTIHRKPVNCIEDVTDAEIKKLAGIALRLPAIAFDAFFEPDTTELMLNPDGKVFHEKLGCPMVHICNMRSSEAEEFIRKVAGYHRLIVNHETSNIDCVFPLDDSRFAGLIPPIVEHSSFTIRKRAVRVLTLEDYISSGVMTVRQSEIIRQAVLDKQNIVVLGGTGSGKTTLGNTVLHEMTLSAPGCRQIIIEDTPELKSTAGNKVNLMVTGTTSMTDLVRISLRLRPDRIIVGEVRGAEAFDLMQVWNTGHPGGIATLHANDCASGLRRFRSLISLYPEAPLDPEPDIAEAINVMVYIEKFGKGRRLKEIVRVHGYDPKHTENNGYQLEML